FFRCLGLKRWNSHFGSFATPSPSWKPLRCTHTWCAQVDSQKGTRHHQLSIRRPSIFGLPRQHYSPCTWGCLHRRLWFGTRVDPVNFADCAGQRAGGGIDVHSVVSHYDRRARVVRCRERDHCHRPRNHTWELVRGEELGGCDWAANCELEAGAHPSWRISLSSPSLTGPDFTGGLSGESVLLPAPATSASRGSDAAGHREAATQEGIPMAARAALPGHILAHDADLLCACEFVKFKFGSTDEIAAYNSSVAQLAPIFIVPFLGLLLDRYGQRCLAVLASTLSLLVSILILSLTYLTPLLGMAIYSLSLSLGPVSLISAVPLILPLSSLGTALGVLKSGSNVGSTIADILVGLLQDSDPEHGYDGVMRFYVWCSTGSAACAVWLWVVDRQWYAGVLDMNDEERKAWSDMRREENMEEEADGKLKWLNWVYGGLYGAGLVASWVLFFVFVFNAGEK
ncbi:hypothetical protein BC936DRAFT_148169, partial [Jimgerdemannia flammicorona]